MEEVRRVTLGLGADNPVANYVRNVIITSDEGECVRTCSGGIAPTARGCWGIASYRCDASTADGLSAIW
jgi:hypothetical protein